MTYQTDLLLVPSAPILDVARYASWPFPGLTARETAQSVLAQSAEYKQAIAATILSGPAWTTESEVRAAIPQDWKDALGRFFHASLCQREGEQHGIDVKHVSHDGGGFHIGYRARPTA
ncbi:hypothetical protein [Cupriavidus oxalaticus]|uniref:Uncharacterized protein n=1 Tax=Cupriavidus oxalaticus TaxID=96344 RepID=A0A4P7LKN7_9BURK|nr:hypothetical protein [Cupriavidus oxalaticus]QBY56128.1 hypothetical protein E0W60_34280 [Cupriavidus oxalaticus]